MGHRAARERSRKNTSGADAEDEREQTDRRDSTERRNSTERRDPTGKRDPAAKSGGEGVRDEYIDYDPGPDHETLSARYGVDVGEGEGQRLGQLESEFGSERVQRWADEES